MGWKKWTLIIIAILILLYTLIGFLVVPMVTEAVLPDKLSEQLNRSVAIEDISLNPYTLTLAVNGLQIRDKSGSADFVAFDEFFINVQWASLFKLGLVTKAIRLKNPFIRVVRTSKTEFNFSDLIPAETAEKGPEAEEEGEPFRFRLSNIKLIDGNFEFLDAPMDKTHRFSNVMFNIPLLSNFETRINDYAEPVISGELNGTGVKIDVFSKPFADSMETLVDVSLTGISLPYYFGYVPLGLGFDITDGNLDAKSTIDFKKAPDGRTDLEVSGVLNLNNLRLTAKNAAELVFIPAAQLEMAPSKPLNRQVRLADLSINQPVISMVRDADGEFNLTAFGPSKEGAGEKNTPNQSAADSGSVESKDSKASGAAAPASDPFIFEINNFALNAGTLNYKDFAVAGASSAPHAGPVKMSVENINLNVTDFSTRKDHRAELDFSASLDPEAALSVNGKFGVSPLTVDTAVKWQNVALNQLQPYFPDPLKLVLTSGDLDITGNASLRSKTDAGLSAQFKGDAGIDGLTLVESKTARDFLKWQSVDLSGLDVSWNPTAITLKTLAIEGLRQTLVVQKDGGLNLSRAYAAAPAEKEQPAQASAASAKEKASAPGETAEKPMPFPVSIGEIKLRDIDVSFTDYHIEPNYSAQVKLSEGSIKGLSSQAFEGARISLKGAVNDHAPLDISGRINPLLADILLDIRFDLQNMELSPFSAYSGKYIGKEIEKGKLDLDLNYLIENKKLEAENRVLLDQFNLGRRIESETAVNLPVGMAIALLKDRKGEINLDLPISGRLDDPQFSITGIIIQSLKNIVTKAATSPFDLVGQIVAGGEELKYIEFEAGSDELAASSAKKLDSINELLYKRPELALELTGFVNTERDREVLKDKALERKIRAAKWARHSKKGDEEAVPFSEVELSGAEYRKYLRQVYQAEVLSAKDPPADAKPLDDETLTASEMKSKIREQIGIKDAKLRLLAQHRVQAVKKYILKDERIAAKRLFIREAETLSPKDKGGYKKSRVELSLK